MNWSFSSLMNYESCAHRFKLAKIDRLPEPPRPPDNPLERGNRVHNRYEAYIKGESQVFDNEAKNSAMFREATDHLRLLYTLGMATSEDDWLFNRDWDEVPKKMQCSVHGREKPVDDCEECGQRVWLWAKLDACVMDEDAKKVIVIDFKTGKSQYKAIEHVQQLQLYAAIAALKYPWAETIIPELWYLDEGHVRQSEYTLEQALGFVGRFEVRADRIFKDRLYRPNPNVQTCRWCSYGPRNGTGACAVGV